MANSVALAELYKGMLDEVLLKASLTTDLNADTETLKFLNANTVNFPKLSMDGLGNTDRNGNFVDGDVTVTYEAHTLSIDRNRKFQVDPMDNEESINTAFGKLAGEFVRTKVVPEMDAIRFQKLYAKASTTAEADLDSTTVLSALDTAIYKMDDDEVPEENRRLYVSNEVASLIEAVNGFDKNINMNAVAGNVGFRVLSYKGIPVVKVPKGRFYTAITLYDGVTAGQEAGGYIKNVATGKDINFILACVPYVRGGVIKHNPVGVIPGASNPNSDKDIYKYRIYHDFFILDNKVTAIYAHNKTT